MSVSETIFFVNIKNVFFFFAFISKTFVLGRKYAMLKLKILLSTILRNYRVISDLNESDFKLQGDIILKREEGFQIRLQSRKKLMKNNN